MQAHSIDIDGPVHYLDYGGDGPPIVLVHGLGGNGLNWLSVAGPLTRYGRVLAPDLPGFGRTPPHGRSCSVQANRQVVQRFIEQVAGEPSLLIGNSMGGLISLLQAASAPSLVRGLVLADPAIPRAASSVGDPRIIALFGLYSIPGAGEAYLTRRARKLGPEGLVREALKICTVDANRIRPGVVDQLIEVATWREQQPWPRAAYLQAARSIVSILARRARFNEMARSVSVPTLLIHGEQDRLVPVAAARELAARAPGWRLRILDDTGHIPMLEAPERFMAEVDDWLSANQSVLLPEAEAN